MKKLIFAMLLASSTVLFAKTEEPKAINDLQAKEVKASIIENESKEEKTELKTARDPFSDCVLNNSIGLWAMFFTIGVPVEGEFIQALATVQCANSFGLLP